MTGPAVLSAKQAHLQATGLDKLDGQGTDKEAVTQQLLAVQQQVEQVKGENEELRTFFQEALHVSSFSKVITSELSCVSRQLANCRLKCRSITRSSQDQW